MKAIAGIFLMLVSLFCGGCSLAFLTLGAGMNGFGSTIFFGLVIAAVSGYSAVKLLAEPKPSTLAPRRPAETSESEDDRLR
jgi:hypothetical protein